MGPLREPELQFVCFPLSWVQVCSLWAPLAHGEHEQPTGQVVGRDTRSLQGDGSTKDPVEQWPFRSFAVLWPPRGSDVQHSLPRAALPGPQFRQCRCPSGAIPHCLSMLHCTMRCPSPGTPWHPVTESAGRQRWEPRVPGCIRHPFAAERHEGMALAQGHFGGQGLKYAWKKAVSGGCWVRQQHSTRQTWGTSLDQLEEVRQVTMLCKSSLPRDSFLTAIYAAQHHPDGKTCGVLRVPSTAEG